MGVDNLLPFVNNALKKTHIKRVCEPNTIAAVDISHWMYKASYACPEALYHREKVHVAYKTIVKYIDNYVSMLKANQIELIFVFDGMKLPAKRHTHKERSERKAEARRLVEKFLARKDSREARKHMLRCIDIKFDVVQQVIDYCKNNQISYIVAPYEADAQLAYLSRNNFCQYVITEDTDLILYQCEKVIYKLDTTGNCVLYERSKLGSCLGPKGSSVDFEKFRRICILSGCDYLKNIPSVGLQSAKKFFLLTQQDNIRLLLPKLSTYLKAPKLAGKVTEDYIDGFVAAETTFRHHIVWDPNKQRLVPVEPYPKGASSSDFPSAGKLFCRRLARAIVHGEIDLDNLKPETDLDSESETENTDDEADNTIIDTEQASREPVRVAALST